MKNVLISLRALLVFTLLCGLLYPLLVTFAGRSLFASQAGGSLLRRNGEIVGSRLIAQKFASDRYFRARPSAINYDSSASGGSNLSVTSADLAKQIREREAEGAVSELRFASGSGLDPEISPASARSQISRVAKARGLSEAQRAELEALVEVSLEAPQMQAFGEWRLNVLLLNLKLDERWPQ